MTTKNLQNPANPKPQPVLLQAVIVLFIAAAFFGLGWAYGFSHGPRIASAQSVLPYDFDAQRQVAREELTRHGVPANESSRKPAAISQLQTLRTQLDLYRNQHNGSFPALAQLQDNWSIFTRKSDAQGRFTDKAGFGPYLTQPPVNPFNNSAKVASVNAPSADSGWTYNPKTGELYLVIPRNFTDPDFNNAQYFVRPQH